MHNLQTLKSYHIISLMLIMSKPSCISSKKIVFYYHSSFKDGGTWMGLILLQSQSRYIIRNFFNESPWCIFMSCKFESIDFLRVNCLALPSKVSRRSIFVVHPTQKMEMWRLLPAADCRIFSVEPLLKGTWNFISPSLKIGKLNRDENFVSISI